MRRLTRIALALGLGFTLALPALARPGGGSSFRSSSGSSRSSSSGSRSSSSWSSSKSSSGSSRSGSSGTTTPSKPAPRLVSVRTSSGKARATALGAAPVYGIGPARPEATRRTGYDERGTMRVGFGFLTFVGLFATTGMIGLGALVWVARRRPKGWSTQARPAEPPISTASERTRLEALRQIDPDFSVVLFEDFVYALFAEAHTARGAGRLETLGPYLTPAARQELARLGNAPVTTVVVGSMRYSSVSVAPGSGSTVSLELEANYTEAGPSGEQSYWTVERWELMRGPYARSRPPERVRVFTCPSCGAPLDKIVGGTCHYCNQVVDSGAFDWVVSRIAVTERQLRPPMLTGTTEEQGTELPTRVDHGLAQALGALGQRDPAFSREALFGRIGLVFSTLQNAWSSLRWELARPYLSDNLWTAQTYWIEAYRKSGLRNMNENARILGLELVRITSDRWYDSATVRVHATGLDFTLREQDGAVVGGNRTRERTYSEYWTLIRSSGARGAARSDPNCPSCGAALDVNAAGQCGHCQVKVTSGQFDWVLSRIEQDESYEG